MPGFNSSKGDLDVNGEKLSPGNGASTDEEKELNFASEKGRAFSVIRPPLTYKQINKTKGNLA